MYEHVHSNFDLKQEAEYEHRISILVALNIHNSKAAYEFNRHLHPPPHHHPTNETKLEY